ncbi:MAG TPA: universal stress protein, partial [Chthoniobacterales bacterium]|nr:universal stress protein [Chthoniobacterales bacterium]
GVRDYMLRYMGQVFIGHALGPVAGTVAAWAVSITFGLLLLSAVNTAIIDLISISFLMSKDEELPPIFAKLNQFGVPNFSLVVMSLIPAALVVWVGDVSGLADLYAVGVVGAIATNLGATATDWRLPLLLRERILMLVTFGVLFAIEVTLFIEKPRARVFAVTILAIGLILRGLAREYSLRKAAKIKEKVDELSSLHGEIKNLPSLSTETAKNFVAPVLESSGMPYTFQALHSEIPCSASASVTMKKDAQSIDSQHSTQHHGRPVLAAVRRLGKTLDFAVSETREGGKLLYVLFVREQPIIAPGDHKRKWQEDPEAKNIFESLKEKGLGESILLCYAVSDSPADTIADLASTIGAECVIIGASQRGALVNMLRGDMVTKLSKLTPEDMYLVVCG